MHDSSKKIEVSADSLVVSQGNSSAEFKGNVLAGQGTLKIEADRLIVEYKADSEGTATGAIHSMTAVYMVTSGTVKMSGDVILTQGRNAIAGSILNIDLNSGDAVFEGRVRTVLEPEAN